MEMLSEFLNELLRQAMPVVAAALVAWIAASLSTVWKNFKAAKPELAVNLAYAANMAIAAAEKAGIDDAIKDKKEFAVGVAENYLQSIGLNVDLDIIADAIEEAGMESGLFKWSNGDGGKSTMSPEITQAEGE